MSSQNTILFIGATGYLGSEFLVILNQKLPNFHVVTLLRNATQERRKQLQAVYPNSSIVEGTLNDDAIITEQAAKADIVINCASSDHLPSVMSILAGLKINSKNNPGKPPLYIHVSGCGIVSDNARGNPVAFVQEWTDIGLDIHQCDRKNPHLDSDIPIVEAGSQNEVPIRTIIYYPAQIYGVGQGIQKTPVWMRTFLGFAKQLGYVGTWGPGANSMNNIHVRDCAGGLLVILKAVLKGEADEGPEGLYFSASMEPRISFYEWTKVMGDYLYQKGVVQWPGSCPMPDEVVEPHGKYGWSLLGGNQFVHPQRLAKLGWEPAVTKKTSLLESLTDMIDVALQEV